MSIFSWFTSAEKSADKVLNGMVKGIDALVLTQEERVQYVAKAQDVWLETQKALAQETSARSVSRRFVAWGVILMVSLITITSTVLIAMGYKDMAGDVIKIADALWWGESFVAVIVFYFGNHIATKLKGST